MVYIAAVPHRENTSTVSGARPQLPNVLGQRPRRAAQPTHIFLAVPWASGRALPGYAIIPTDSAAMSSAMIVISPTYFPHISGGISSNFRNASIADELVPYAVPLEIRGRVSSRRFARLRGPSVHSVHAQGGCALTSS